MDALIVVVAHLLGAEDREVGKNEKKTGRDVQYNIVGFCKANVWDQTA